MTESGIWSLPLPCTTPPLSLNDKTPAASRRRVALLIRCAVAAAAADAGLPVLRGAEVTLYVRPATEPGGDVGASPTLLACVAGLVEFGAVESRRVVCRCVIEPPGEPGVWLVVESVSR